jgi:hypothetical protein
VRAFSEARTNEGLARSRPAMGRWASEPDGVGAGGCALLERGLAPEAGGLSEGKPARSCDYRDDEAVDALAM